MSRSRAARFGHVPTTSVRRLTFTLNRSPGLIDEIHFCGGAGKSVNTMMTSAAPRTVVSNFGQPASEHAGDGVELLADVLSVGLSEEGADRGGDYLRGALGQLGEHVAGDKDAASLPRCPSSRMPRSRRADRCGRRDHQLHPRKAA